MVLSIEQKSVYLTILDATMILRTVGRSLRSEDRLKEFKNKVFKELEGLFNKMEVGKLTDNDILHSIDKFCEQFGISFGQAQKAINVLLKYHYYMYEKYFDDCIKIKSVLHCPLDSTNLERLGIINNPLTRINKKEYKDIQNNIQNKMQSLGLNKIDFDKLFDKDFLRRRGIEDF